ncbi:MAG TPA: hypothetical protein PKD41_02570 [Solidesulfovibrio sp.]|nr:hypothetical protein [Solidesulfovibrio sp.]
MSLGHTYFLILDMPIRIANCQVRLFYFFKKTKGTSANVVKNLLGLRWPLVRLPWVEFGWLRLDGLGVEFFTCGTSPFQKGKGRARRSVAVATSKKMVPEAGIEPARPFRSKGF